MIEVMRTQLAPLKFAIGRCIQANCLQFSLFLREGERQNWWKFDKGLVLKSRVRYKLVLVL